MLKYILIITTLQILCIMTQLLDDMSTPLNCGEQKAGMQVISGGSYIRRGSYPWHAALVYNRKLLCGATIVSNRTLVTAAHCIKGKDYTHEFNAGDILVSIGVHDLSNPFDTIRINLGVKAIKIHPDWNVNLDQFDADIAVLELAREISFNNFIQPICLAEPESAVARILNGTVVGFGRSEHRETEDIAKKLDIPIVDYHKCSESDDYKNLISASTFCGGPADGSGVCNGDSGGGVYVLYNGRYYLRGIVSAALADPITHCNFQKHAIFTKATDFYGWIKSGGINKYAHQNQALLEEIVRLKELLRQHNIPVSFVRNSLSLRYEQEHATRRSTTRKTTQSLRISTTAKTAPTTTTEDPNLHGMYDKRMGYDDDEGATSTTIKPKLTRTTKAQVKAAAENDY